MLSASDLADLQQSAEEAMPDQVVITRPGSPIVDAYSVVTETWTTVAATRGRVDAATVMPQERILGGQIAAEARPILVVPAGTDLAPADQATVTFAVTGAVVVYEVIDLYGPRSYEITRRALLQQRN